MAVQEPAREHTLPITGPRKLLIDGDWVEAASGKTFETYDPATEDVLARVAHGDAEDVERAVRAARRAFEYGRSGGDDAVERGRLSARSPTDPRARRRVRAARDARQRQAGRVAGSPTCRSRPTSSATWPAGRPSSRARRSRSRVPAPERSHAYTLREPVGVVGQIIPWNFPLLMAAWKLGPVLACGCTVVLKPAEQTPLSALRLGELMQEAGLPPGVLNIVTGFGDAGAAIAAHPGVDKVAFTGSTDVGKKIVQAAAGNLKKVTLELGGKSPQIVLKDADLEVAVPGAANAIFFNHGQCCCAGSRLYVEAEVFDDVVAGVAEQARRSRSARPGPATEMGPLVSQEQLDRVCGYLESGARRAREASPAASASATRATSSSRPCSSTPRRHEGRARGDLRAGRQRRSRSATTSA
jgi:phenylacetaldehyde dehydrogenase